MPERGLPSPENEPSSIMSYDWDNLVILDGCRYDLFVDTIGEAEKRTSLGSCSSEFVERTFTEGSYEDIVYISANPHLHSSKFKNLTGRDPEDVFHSVFHTYQTDWNYEEKTVLPSTVCRDVKTAEKLFPNKRKIIHFMQPHHPFVTCDLNEEGMTPDLEARGNSAWEKAERGEIPRSEMWQGYKENLEYVWGYVKEISKNLDGQTCVTADHGNFIGENGLYHHPAECRTKPVREVPWKTIN
ncbi:hypothetical protein [Candidatus Nanohalococcus occultus]|uniref:hypothetical protein n=1 Tax=Candidatus Nanohalococcus occultus TaxID=2978047 RepID=UPI0039E15ACA